MALSLLRINLDPKQFSQREKLLTESGELSASVFCFPSGVQAIRLKNALGNLVVLPFQGQQIWDAFMHGRRLTMKSMFDQPYPTRDFLSTFGGFLLHCGATAMGVPGPEDKHLLHGELSNAPYQEATLLFGEDEARGTYIGMTGTYRHTVAFNYNYTATPVIKLYQGSSIFAVSMVIHNEKASPMPLMFLEHINFRPVDGGRLVQSVRCDKSNMRVRANVPEFMEAAPGYQEFIKDLQQHPEKHLTFMSEQVYDPEAVFYLNYLADHQGWARTMQIHSDGSVDIVRHRPNQLNRCVRWICRTADQQALGVEPGTAEVEGYAAEKRKGNLRYLAGGDTFICDLEIGVLAPELAQHETSLIEKTIAAGQ